jgi:hypothetical protein
LPTVIAVNSTNIYWIGGSMPGYLNQVPLGGGDAGVLAGNLSNPKGLVIDTENAYFTDNGQVFQVPLTGGTQQVIADNQLGPWGVTVDCGSAYWVDALGGVVDKITPK